MNSEYYKWDYVEFKTYTELQNYVDKIKNLLIGKTINHIFISPDYAQTGSYIQGYDILKDNENVSIDLFAGPVILKINSHKLLINMPSGSHIQISLDGNFEILNEEEIVYTEISSLFSKNVIGNKITDIKITPITEWEAKASVTWYSEDVYGDDMFEQLIIELENGYKFIFCEIFDNTGIFEGT